MEIACSDYQLEVLPLFVCPDIWGLETRKSEVASRVSLLPQTRTSPTSFSNRIGRDRDEDGSGNGLMNREAGVMMMQRGGFSQHARFVWRKARKARLAVEINSTFDVIDT